MPQRVLLTVVTACIIVVGLIAFYDSCVDPSQRVGGRFFEVLLFFGPALLASGVVLVCLAWSVRASRIIWVGTAFLVVAALATPLVLKQACLRPERSRRGNYVIDQHFVWHQG